MEAVCEAVLVDSGSHESTPMAICHIQFVGPTIISILNGNMLLSEGPLSDPEVNTSCLPSQLILVSSQQLL